MKSVYCDVRKCYGKIIRNYGNSVVIQWDKKEYGIKEYTVAECNHFFSL